METVLTFVIVAIAGIGGALTYTIAGPKIRRRIHNDTFRTRSAWAIPHFLVQNVHWTAWNEFFCEKSTLL